jgi:dihydroorotate dehydrogenase electron transfer subunit
VADIHVPEIARTARPGQFLLVRPAASLDPLLGRPLAVAFCDGEDVGLCFQTVGRGTRLLAALTPGAKIWLRGPQGNGFGSPQGKRLLLVGGAMGVAPLVFARQRFRHINPLFFAGVSCGAWSGLVDWLHCRVSPLEAACDDGSMGFHGNVVRLIENRIDPGDEIWACGPLPMMKALHAVATARKALLKVSLEERMACGFGGCMGCVIPTVNGHRRVCVDGPVFDSREVDWDGIA